MTVASTGTSAGQGERTGFGRLHWIFGSGRTGSNWLVRLMGDITGADRWQEPMIGAVLSRYYDLSAHYDRDSFFFSSAYKETWLKSIRSLVLDGAAARFPDFANGGDLIAREPTGSSGAPLLVEALPESRVILLIRDPRDVVASFLDGAKEGGWLSNRSFQASWRKRYSDAEQNPSGFVKRRAKMVQLHAGRASEAYETHAGLKVLVRYEELLSDTLGTMRRIYECLDIPVKQEAIAQAVDKQSWDRIPEEKKGPGKFFRKGVPEGWREDLTRSQVKIVEQVTEPILRKYYSF